jgi:hypothetical protein
MDNTDKTTQGIGKQIVNFCRRSKKVNRNFKLIYLGIALGYTSLKCYHDGLKTLNIFREFKDKEKNSHYISIDNETIESFYKNTNMEFFKINDKVYYSYNNRKIVINDEHFDINDSEYNVAMTGSYSNVSSHFWKGITFPYQIIKNIIPLLILNRTSDVSNVFSANK